MLTNKLLFAIIIFMIVDMAQLKLWGGEQSKSKAQANVHVALSTPPLKNKFKCKECGIIFYAKKSKKRIYCSLICRNKNLTARNGTNLICQTCKRQFYAPKSQLGKKYCSRDCRLKSPAIKSEYVCSLCQKKYEYLTKRPSKKRRICSNCINKNNKLRNAEYTFFHKRKLINQRGQCEKCGLKEIHILGIHHLDRNRNNNENGNLMVLCPNCHSRAHCQHIPHSLQRQNVL